MSMASSTPGIYRLFGGSLPTGITNANVNDNITFVTNIPSLDFALRIWRIRWESLWSVWNESVSTPTSINLVAQLTENQSKTSVLNTDTSWLDEFFTSELISTSTAASGAYTINSVEQIHDFNAVTTPWTVATKLNLVATKIVGALTSAATTWKPACYIEYTLERLTPDLRDYLAKRLQIQGS